MFIESISTPGIQTDFRIVSDPYPPQNYRWDSRFAPLGAVHRQSELGQPPFWPVDNPETWCEAEINRIAGEIALMSPELDAAKAGTYFERALELRAKSWELRAAMSMARLWRDQGKRDEARDLLVPVYGWFTQGLGTLDLKEGKALLEALAS